MRAKLLIASLTGVLILGGIWFAQDQGQSPCPDFYEREVTVGEKKLNVSVAESHEEKTHGLSGCSELPENAGMLFPYNPSEEVSFWMRDMLMPLDIIWIYEGKVVGIETNIPAPAPGTATKDLPQYKSPGPVDSVLEIKSGGAGEYGIQIGDTFAINSKI